jgi:hypothetical protein
VNTDTEQDEYQDTKVVDINAAEEKNPDSTAEVFPVPIHTRGQKSNNNNSKITITLCSIKTL